MSESLDDIQFIIKIPQYSCVPIDEEIQLHQLRYFQEPNVIPGASELLC